ncbi:HEAT repeat domain-containing protein [Synechococcus sp. CS-1324]|uniref:HEAT repeat domain-containing protein n=1 Tax=Synechococcus sp. CS-1324 TaxID=2847980 RepID=UPI000DB1CB8F|nr:HEAT repeat domain-containing protein [Synechococcus sp. CS-1324]MCT0229348.1 HEAT repeat domain-containing protein [Synechococcus sp. CS-1324]PZU96312.1 MAG: phycocyanin alpha phycocyanobilin lyase [Cyanobium sp.]PZV03689.1 MAG: phycocyanin alpha phycocyanobilin lyase [Cyanobium sp.]
MASPDDPAALIQALQQADSPTSLLQATRNLAAARFPGAALALVEVLGFNNPGAAVAAVDGLIALGPQAVEPLLGNLDGHNYGARAWAVRALAGIGDVRGVEVLERALATDIGPSVRRAAATGLGKLRLESLETDKQAALRLRCLEALLAACEDSEWVVRYAVAVGLEQLLRPTTTRDGRHQRGLAGLAALASDASEDTPVVRLRAALALERLA